MSIAPGGDRESDDGPPEDRPPPLIQRPTDDSDDEDENEEEDEELRRLSPKVAHGDMSGKNGAHPDGAALTEGQLRSLEALRSLNAPPAGRKGRGSSGGTGKRRSSQREGEGARGTSGGTGKRTSSQREDEGARAGVATRGRKAARTSGRESPGFSLGALGCGYKPAGGSPPFLRLSGKCARKPLDPRQYNRSSKKSTDKKVAEYLETKYHKNGFRQAGNALPPALEELIRDGDPDAVIAALEQYEENMMARDMAAQGQANMEARLPGMMEERVAQLRDVCFMPEAEARRIAQQEADTVRTETPKQLARLAREEVTRARLAAEKALKVAQQNMVDALLQEQMATGNEIVLDDSDDGGGKPRAKKKKSSEEVEEMEEDDDDAPYEEE